MSGGLDGPEAGLSGLSGGGFWRDLREGACALLLKLLLFTSEHNWAE